MMIKSYIASKLVYFFYMVIIPQRAYNFLFYPDYRERKICEYTAKLCVYLSYKLYPFI